MRLVLLLVVGSFFAIGCAAQDEIVSAKSADVATPINAPVPSTKTPASPASTDDQALAARRKQQDDDDWAQAQQQYEAQKQQRIN
jgi:hypothetical protein